MTAQERQHADWLLSLHGIALACETEPPPPRPRPLPTRTSEVIVALYNMGID